MKVPRRGILVIAAVVIAAGISAYLLRPKTTVIKFGMMAGSYWDVPNGDCYRIIDDTIKRFETAHPGVRVEYTSGILKQDYSEWISEQVLLGNAPDIFMVEPEDFNTFSADGILKNLNNLISKDKTFHSSDYYTASYEAGRYGNVQYALPYESVPVLMFVNKTLLQRNGISMPADNWTWDDFYRICQKITRDTNGDGRIDQFGCYDYTWEDAVYSNGATLFNFSGTACYLDDAKVVSAVQFLKKLMAVNEGTQPDSREFDLGHVAFRPFLFSDYRAYKPYPWSIKKYSGFDWDCIKMPAGPNGKNTSMLKTLLIGINANTKHTGLAWEFLKMLTYDETTQQEIFKYSQGVSVLKNVTKSPKTSKLLDQDAPNTQVVNTKTLDEVMKNAITVQKFRKYDDAIQMLSSGIDKIISADADIKPRLSALKREVMNGLAQ